MKTIWKFPLKVEDEQTINMPIGAKILCVQMQGNVPTLWAVVDETAAKEPKKIYCHGTGHYINPDATVYLGTVQMLGGGLIFHFFRGEE